MSHRAFGGNRTYDVLVIGGGPAGCQAAVHLAGRGRRVAVLEQKANLDGPVCCTGIVSEDCVRAYSIDESLIWRHARGARLVAPSGRDLAFHRDTAQAAILDRAAFNAAWGRRATGAGAQLAFETRASAVAVGPDSVKVRTIGPDGEGCLEARAVVIASGSGPALTTAAGLGKCADVAVGAQAEVISEAADEVTVFIGDRVSPGFFGWLVPTRPGRALVGLLCRRRPRERLKTLLTTLVASGRIDSADVDVRLGSITLAPLARTYGDRLIVVGTAAGQVKPITGGGIYFGLLCADVAARTLDSALAADDLSARRLATYQRQWKRRIGRELLAGRWARHLYEGLRDQQLDKIVDIMIRDRTLETILKHEGISFDGHGALVRHLIGNVALAKLIGTGLVRGMRRHSVEEI